MTPRPDNPAVALKSFETRSWKPTADNLETIQSDGLLIHASVGWRKDQRSLMDQGHFAYYRPLFEPMPFGAIIGWVRVGRIFRTENWLEEFRVKNNGQADRWADENKFGDYSPYRYAWEFVEFKKFPIVIPAKGQLSLWNYNMPEKIGYNLSGGGHASFDGMPDQKTVAAVEEMVNVARQTKLYQ